MDTAARNVFRRIYATNYWGGDESSSGTGSSLAATARVREALADLVRRHGVARVLDVACGDFHWMSQVDLGDAAYLGFDIVPELVAQNHARHARPGRRFEVRDSVREPLPVADLVVARDVLVHLPLADVQAFAANVRRSGATWLLATTFGPGRTNQEIAVGEWRPLDLCAAPFHWPPPAERIVEAYEPPPYHDKALGLWRVATLP